MTHLTDTQLQGLADGTLRGPEGMAAREHCEDCGGCGAELALYAALAGKLSALRDPDGKVEVTDALTRRVFQWHGERWVELESTAAPSPPTEPH